MSSPYDKLFEGAPKPAATPSASPGTMNPFGTSTPQSAQTPAAPMNPGFQTPAAPAAPQMDQLNQMLGNLTSAGIAPLSFAANVINHIPLGGFGADEHFATIGEFMRTHDPEAYEQWKVVDASSKGDLLGGGNQRADFNKEWLTKYDDMAKDSHLGHTPEFAIGSAGVGSLGGLLASAIMGAMNLTGGTAQRALAGSGVGGSIDTAIQSVATGLAPGLRAANALNDKFDTAEGAIKFDENRLQQVMREFAVDPKSLSEVERRAVEGVTKGGWSNEHALDYMTRNFQSFSSDFATQMAGAIVTDPTNLATIGAGAASKAGLMTGARLAETGAAATTAYEKAALNIYRAQQSAFGPAFRAIRIGIDPLSAMPKTTATEGIKDMLTGNTIQAFQRAYGPSTYGKLRRLSEKYGFADDFRRATEGYTASQARLYTAKQAVITQMKSSGGETLLHVNPDEVIEPMLHAAPRDVLDDLTDHIYSTAKNVFTRGDIDQLAGRMAAWAGRSKAEWATDIAQMSREERSALHALTHNGSAGRFHDAIGQVDREAYAAAERPLPLDDLVILNDNNLDDVAAQGLLDGIEQAETTAEKVAIWNLAVEKYSHIADLGRANSEFDLTKYTDAIHKDLADGALHTRAMPDQLGHHSLLPLRDFIARNTIDGEPLWNIGFKPREEVAFGLRRHPVSGKLIASRAPTVSHVYGGEAPHIPGAMETVRDVLGRVVGQRASSAITRPIDAVEEFIRAGLDGISGQRVAENVTKRFEAAMVEKHGLTGPEARALLDGAREMAGLERTTLRGVTGDNVWRKAEELVAAHNGPLTQQALNRIDRHILLDELLIAAEGDLRIVGVGNKLAQNLRTRINDMIGGDNWTGHLTQNVYSFMRYKNPIFIIQRITDGPFYLALQGHMPVGRRTGDRALNEVGILMRNMGRTGYGRDLAVDLGDYTTQSQLTTSIWDLMQRKAHMGTRIEAIQGATDSYIRNNMTKLMYNDLGNIIRETFDEAREAIKAIAKDDPDLAASMTRSLGKTENSFADVRRVMSEHAGRSLDEQEAGLKYVQSQFASQARQRATDGGVSLRGILHEADMMSPAGHGEARRLHFDDIAREFGLKDEAALRAQVQRDGITWFRDYLRDELGAHPDFVKAAVDGIQFEWAPFWKQTEEALGLTPELSASMQEVIAKSAQMRGLDPHEYLSQIMHQNLGEADLGVEMGALADILRPGSQGDLETVVRAYRGHMDRSQQRTLVEVWKNELPAEAAAARAEGDIARADELTAIHATLERGAGRRAAPPVMRPRASDTVIEGRDLIRENQQEGIASAIDQFHDMFPDIPKGKVYVDAGFEARNGDDALAEFHPDTGDISLNPRYFNRADADIQYGKVNGQNEVSWGTEGRPALVSTTPDGTLRHELGHKLDEWMRDVHYKVDPTLSAAEQANLYATRKAYRNFIEDFYNSGRGDRLSYYAGKPLEPGAKPGQEAAGELYDLAFGPVETRDAFFVRMREENLRIAGEEGMTPAEGAQAVDNLIAQLEDDVRRYRTFVEETEVFKPVGPDPIGVAYDQAFDKAFADRISKRATYQTNRVHPNPEVEGAYQHFSKWAQQTLENSPVYMGEGIAGTVRSIPTDAAFAYNHTEALVEQLLRQKIELSEVDAYRLAEMAGKRNAFNRSLNHPIFGLYPASYMWAKVLPETLKFFARNPYAATYQILDVERAITVQRELDEDFRTAQGTLDESEMAYLAGYLTPSLPWEDMAAHIPAWSRVLANGKFDPQKMTDDEFARMDPSRWYRSFANLYDEGAEFVGSQLESGEPPVPESSGMFAPQTATPSAPPEPTTGPVQATDLNDPLAEAMAALAGLLSD